MIFVRQIEAVSAEITTLDTALRKETMAKLFENGRHLSAWIGLVPENDSTGGKVRQNGLSKKGDHFLRSLLVSGAMAVVQQAQKRPDKHPWVTKLLGRMSARQAAISIANKTARIAWAIMVKGGAYEAGHRAPQYRAEVRAAAG